MVFNDVMVGGKLTSTFVRWALIFTLGLGIGGIKGCSYGEKRVYKAILQEKQTSKLIQRDNPYILIYEKENNKIYAAPLSEINSLIETKNSNLEKIVKR